MVPDFNTIFYDNKKKIIVQKIEKKVDTGEKKGVMVTEKTIAHGTNKDPKLLARASATTTLSNVNNVDRIVYDLEEQKKTLSQMKETLNKERGEGQNLRRKHADILSEIEKSKEACQILQSDKVPLILSVNIIEG